MDNRQRRTLQAFISIKVFLENGRLTPAPPLLAGMRKSLEASIDRIRSLRLEQHIANNSRDGKVELRRRKLRRERMMPLVRIAKPLLAFAPRVEPTLRVPHARADAHTVATAALKMADALEPHARLLASAGCSKDFLRQLRQEARALALAVKTTEKARQRTSVATAAIAAEFKKAMKTVTVIEGLVMLNYGGDPATQAVWRRTRRVSARIGRPKQRSKRPQVPAPPPS
jgi:hypothetical protein